MSRTDADSIPKTKFFENYEDIWENGLDFSSRNDASSIPKIRSLEFLLDFLSRNDASSIPRIWIFFQNSRIGVKCVSLVLTSNDLKFWYIVYHIRSISLDWRPIERMVNHGNRGYIIHQRWCKCANGLIYSLNIISNESLFKLFENF